MQKKKKISRIAPLSLSFRIRFNTRARTRMHARARVFLARAHKRARAELAENLEGVFHTRCEMLCRLRLDISLPARK